MKGMLRAYMQATMLVAAKKLALGGDTFAFWQMHAAMGAAHHILVGSRRSFPLRLVPLFYETF